MDSKCEEKQSIICNKIGMRPGCSHPEVMEGFLVYIRRLARKEDIGDDTEEISETLNPICASYFEYCLAWYEYLGTAGGTRDPNSGNHPEAAKLKTEGGAITRQMQKFLLQLASCEALIYSVMSTLDEDIQSAKNGTKKEHADIQWTYDLPPQIATMTKKRNVLSDYMVQVRQAKPVVEKLEVAFITLERTLDGLLGSAKRKKTMDEFTGLLRKSLYTQAQDFIFNTAKTDKGKLLRFDRKQRAKKWDLIIEIADLVVLCIEKRKKHLTGRGGRMFLREWEVRLAYDSMSKELEKARSFLNKYEVPEISYRRDALERQSKSLAQLVQFKDALLLYEDLLKKRFSPMLTLKDVRAFEEGTLKKVRYMTETVSRDLENNEQAILKLASGPDPESVPDEILFENIENIPALGTA